MDWRTRDALDDLEGTFKPTKCNECASLSRIIFGGLDEEECFRRQVFLSDLMKMVGPM